MLSQHVPLYFFFCPFIWHLTPFLNIETPFKHQNVQLNWDIPAIFSIFLYPSNFLKYSTKLENFHVIHIFRALFRVLQPAVCIWHQLFNSQRSQLQVIQNSSSLVKHVIPKPWILIDWLQGFYSI